MNLDFVRTGSSHMHRCRAFLFALAGLFLFGVEVSESARFEGVPKFDAPVRMIF